MIDEHRALVERLATGVNVANPPKLALAEPDSSMEVVAAWARAQGLKRGAYATPPARYLVPMVVRWCAAQGWAAEPGERQVGRGLYLAGFRPTQRHGWRGYGVDASSSRRLWEVALLEGCPATPPKRRRKPPVPKGPPPLMRERHSHARPVVDSTLRVYPSAALAGAMARVAGQVVSQAIGRGSVAAGRRWRHLTPEEVAALPPETRAGDCVRTIQW
jgi:hypothetical protein